MSLDLKRQLVAQLVESSRLLRNYIDHRAKGRGTTRAQWIVLFRLRQQEGLSQVDLADVLELQPISLVRLLDRLVEHGLLERRHDPKDRRANRLFLTASGRQLVDDLDSLRDAIANDVLRDVPRSRRSKPACRRSGRSRSASKALPILPAVSRPNSLPAPSAWTLADITSGPFASCLEECPETAKLSGIHCWFSRCVVSDFGQMVRSEDP